MNDDVKNLPVIVPTYREHKTLSQKRLTPNDYITAEEWDAVKNNGAIATARLHRILAHNDFEKLPVKEQLVAIKIAQDAAYKPTVIEDKAAVTINVASQAEINALKTLSADAYLPEMRKSDARKAGH